MTLRSTHRLSIVVAALAVPCVGCAGVQTRPRSRTVGDDCSRHIAAAHAALAAPPETGVPPGHTHAVAMHEYHMCLASAAAAR
jgi:hypothetical protein